MHPLLCSSSNRRFVFTGRVLEFSRPHRHEGECAPTEGCNKLLRGNYLSPSPFPPCDARSFPEHLRSLHPTRLAQVLYSFHLFSRSLAQKTDSAFFSQNFSPQFLRLSVRSRSLRRHPVLSPSPYGCYPMCTAHGNLAVASPVFFPSISLPSTKIFFVTCKADASQRLSAQYHSKVQPFFCTFPPLLFSPLWLRDGNDSISLLFLRGWP